MKGDDIAERLLEFAVAVLEITTRLPANSPGRQPRTGEQRTGNEERRMKKEVRESRYWLNVIQRAKLLDTDLSGLLREATELAAILAASVKTARTGSK